ncbi:MAG: PQQ-binding-like beta-propeller repeat protein, partial [Thermomicrobiales bacterium]
DTLVQAIDGSIGEIKWTSNIPAYLANPVVAGTTLIVPTVDGLVTIDPDDGSTQAILEYSFESPEPYFADKATIRVSGDLAYISIATLSGIQILITDGADILQSGLIPASATSAASYPVAMYAYDGRLLVLPRDSPVYWFGPESESAPSATPEPNATPDS